MPSAPQEPQIAPSRVGNTETTASWGKVEVDTRTFSPPLTCLMERLLGGPEAAPQDAVLGTLGFQNSERSCFSSFCKGDPKGSNSLPRKADSVTGYLKEHPAGPGGGNSNS